MHPNSFIKMSARQIARLRALVEEKIRQEKEKESEIAEEEEEEEFIESKPHASFSVFSFYCFYS